MPRHIPRNVLLIAACCGAMPHGVSPFDPATASAAPIDDFNVALTLYRKSRWEPAAEAFAAFVTANPRHPRRPSAELYRGLSLVNLGRHADARGVLEEFVRKYPEHPYHPDAAYRVGECSYYLDELKRADAELTAFLRRHPRHPLVEWAMPYAADAKLRLGEAAAAMEMFAAAVRQFPNGRLVEDARFGLARASEAAGEPEKARRIDLKIVEAGGAYAPRSLDALAGEDFAAGRYAEAAAAFDRILADYPQSSVAAGASLNAGFAYYRLGDFENAARRFERAAGDAATGGTATVWLGMTRQALGDEAAATAAFENALSGNAAADLKAEAAFRWADALAGSGAYAEALPRYDAAAEFVPDSPLAARASVRAATAALAAGDLTAAERRVAEAAGRVEGLEGDERDELLWRNRLTLARVFDARAAEGGEGAADEAGRARRAYRMLVENSPVAEVVRRARLRWAAHLEAGNADAEAVAVAAPLLTSLFSEEAAEVERARGEVEVLIVAARAKLATGDAGGAYEAAARFRDLVPAARRGPDAGVVFAVAAAATGRTDEAVRAWGELLDADVPAESARSAARRLAETAFERGLYELSARLFADELSLLGEEGDRSTVMAARSGRGWALLEGGKFDEAAETFGAVAGTEIDGLDAEAAALVPEAAHLVGRAYESAGKLEEAVAAYTAAFERFAPAEPPPAGAEADGPVRYTFLSGLQAARVSRRLGKDEEADAAYAATAEAFANAGTLDKLLDEWALLHYEDGRYARADALFRRLAESRPDSPLADDALLSVAEGELIAGDVGTAAVTLAALAGEPDAAVVRADGEVRQRAAYLLVAAKVTARDWEAVKRTGERFLSMFDDGAEAAEVGYRVADAELRLGEVDAAIERAESILAEAPPEVRFTDWFARVPLVVAEGRRRVGDLDAVLKAIESVRAAEAPPAAIAEAEQIAGQALLKKARFDEARKAFRRALGIPEIRLTETAAKAEYGLAQTYFLQEKWRAAQTSAFRAYSLYDLDEIRAPALLMVARCDEALGKRNDAVRSYADVRDEFPGTEYATQAAARIDELIPPGTTDAPSGTP